MSMKKWRKLAEEKAKLNQQTNEIHQKFKMNKMVSFQEKSFLNQLQKGLIKIAPLWKKRRKKRSRKFPITQWMNLTKFTLLVMNSDRTHPHQHHHQHHHHHHHHHHHPHIKKLLMMMMMMMMMMMIFHHHPNR